MTENEMLYLEKENYTTIHLHLVGIFWRAYQRSACGFCKEKRPYKINIRSNKRQRTTVFFLGFPDSALQEILAADDYTRVDDSHIVSVSAITYSSASRRGDRKGRSYEEIRSNIKKRRT